MCCGKKYFRVFTGFKGGCFLEGNRKRFWRFLSGKTVLPIPLFLTGYFPFGGEDHRNLFGLFFRSSSRVVLNALALLVMAFE